MIELSLDGLVGPTHHFGGHSPGNKASISSKGSISHPKQAALQGLEKMSLVKTLGGTQGVLPPHLRPDLETLATLGYTIETAPLEIMLLVSSASSMWAANSGVMTPSCDSEDGKVHITPANLIHSFHRFLETKRTAEMFKQIFPSDHFIHHPPIPAHPSYSDEGAANHVRLNGLHLFIYTTNGRQSKLASMAVARSHGILERSLFLEQNPTAVEHGVFHNDVISFGKGNLFIAHEKAFKQGKKDLDLIREKYSHVVGGELNLIEVLDKDFSIQDTVSTYFFNSQIVNDTLIAAKECENHPGLPKLPFKKIVYVDLNQSMRNGGGPACLKVSIDLTKSEMDNVNPAFLFTETLEQKLKQWIGDTYPETLEWTDLTNVERIKRFIDSFKQFPF